jgi:hypothetical protein
MTLEPFELLIDSRELEDREEADKFRFDSLYIRFVDREEMIDKKMTIWTNNVFRMEIPMSGESTWNMKMNKLMHRLGFNLEDVNLKVASGELIFRDRKCQDILKRR